MDFKQCDDGAKREWQDFFGVGGGRGGLYMNIYVLYFNVADKSTEAIWLGSIWIFVYLTTEHLCNKT